MTDEDSDSCSLYSLDSIEAPVVSSSPMSDGVCFEIIEIEKSPNQSLLLRSNNSKPVSEGSSGLKCWYTNATSLTSEKLDELRAECVDTAYDVRFVTETWFNDQSVINIEGYDCFRRDRSNKRGGGVCIYTSSSGSFNFREINDVQLNSRDIEQVWCVADSGKELILLGCIYRPKIIRNNIGEVGSLDEHRKRDMEINKSIYRANSLVRKGTYQGMLLVGDFNFTELFWNENESKILTEAEGPVEFINCLNKCFLTQNVFFKTFQQELSRLTNILDLVITEAQERVEDLKAGSVLGGKDHGHLSISWTYKTKGKDLVFGDKFRKTKFNYKRGDYAGMNVHFGSMNWESIFEGMKVGECYRVFLEKYVEACELFIPKINAESKRRVRSPWLSKELKLMMRIKNEKWCKFVSGGRKSDKLNNEYKEQCRVVKQTMNKNISEYEFILARNYAKNPKALYGYMKSKQRVCERIGSLNRKDGSSTTDKVEIAELLNEQFESVFTVDEGDAQEFGKRTEFTCNGDGIINRQDILVRLNKLNCEKAPGGDGVTQRVLMNCSEKFSVVLEVIFNRAMEDGDVPVEWREANIYPLFKRGSKLQASNYRPVSLTSVCCKVMEGIVRDNITIHLNRHNLISARQHGFVHQKACVTNLLECQHKVSAGMGANKPMDVLYTDFEKAFDKVSHRKLMIKLEAYGIGGKLLKWIKSFLTDRRQKVVMGTAVSKWRVITSGVPQGSVLGPLLFVIYINDLPDRIINVFEMYADDSKVIAGVEDETDTSLQVDINEIKNWCTRWSMSLNSGKCKIMHFGKQNPRKSYYIEGVEGKVWLETTEVEKDLGVMISSDGRNSKQVEAAVSKANRALGRMRKTFKYFNIKLFKTLYPAFVRTHLEFASAVWNSMSRKDINKLEGIQKRATKMVIELRGLEYEERLRVLGMTSLETRRKRGDLLQIYKIKKGFEKVELDMDTRGTGGVSRRHNSQIIRDKHVNTPMRDNFLLNRNATTWNMLPSEIAEADTVNQFKARLDKHMSTETWRRSVYRNGI